MRTEHTRFSRCLLGSEGSEQVIVLLVIIKQATSWGLLDRCYHCLLLALPPSLWNVISLPCVHQEGHVKGRYPSVINVKNRTTSLHSPSCDTLNSGIYVTPNRSLSTNFSYYSITSLCTLPTFLSCPSDPPVTLPTFLSCPSDPPVTLPTFLSCPN